MRENVVNQTEATSRTTFDKLTLALDSGAFVDVRRMLNGLPPGDVAHLLDSHFESCDPHSHGHRKQRFTEPDLFAVDIDCPADEEPAQSKQLLG